jgi:hypothetical protein
MLIKSNLFSKGHPLKTEPGLSPVLESHKRGILDRIRNISNLSLMTDSFLQQVVSDSFVEPLVIHFDKITKKLRTEEFDGSQLPFNQIGDRGRRYPKQVARLSIPFTGDKTLLGFAPIPCGMNLPKGEVYGNTIQFDVILRGTPDDAQRVPAEIEKNREMMATFAAAINKQVNEFNASLPPQVNAAFTAKLDELTKQHSIFDGLGITEEPEPPALAGSSADAQLKKGKARAVQIIQIIDKMYVQQLNQTNNNIGDVNNAIQPN